MNLNRDFIGKVTVYTMPVIRVRWPRLDSVKAAVPWPGHRGPCAAAAAAHRPARDHGDEPASRKGGTVCDLERA